VTFFDRPGSIGQAGDGPPNGGGGDRLPKLFLESLAVFFESKVVVGFQLFLGSHSLSIASFLEGLPEIGLGSTSPVSRRLLSQRS
jgi:hypothetical protein